MVNFFGNPRRRFYFFRDFAAVVVRFTPPAVYGVKVVLLFQRFRSGCGEIPPPAIFRVPDYPLYVIDIGHDEELSFHSRALRELKEVLSSIYAGTAAANKTPVHASTLALAGVLTGSKKLYDAAAEWKGGQREVCRALDEMCENAIKETKEKYVAELKEMDAVIAEKNTVIAEKNTAIAEKDTAIAEKDTAIAEKDAEIDRLRKQLEVLKAAQHNHEPY